MTTNPFDVDDLLSDFCSLKISALQNAAKISPLVKDRTLGPENAENVPQNACAPNLTITTSNSPKGVKNLRKSVGDYSPSTILDESRSLKHVDISNCTEVSFKMYLQDAEKQRISKVKKQMAERQSKINEMDRLRSIRHNESLKDAQKTVAAKVIESEKKVLEALEVQEKLAREEEEKRKAAIRDDNKRIQDITQTIKKQDEERKKKHLLFETIRNHNTSFNKMTDLFTKTIESLDKEIAQNFAAQKKSVDTLTKYFQQVLISVNTRREIMQNDVDKAAEICKQMEAVNGEVIEIIMKLQKDLSEKLEKENLEKIEKEKQAAEQQKQHDVVDNNSVQQQSQIVSDFSQFASKESLEFYSKIQSFYEQHQSSVQKLLEDQNMRTYRFNCQKAINIPVNAISAVSKQHLLDKYIKLASLLAGNPVNNAGIQISTNDHPLGKTYCTLLLAKKFVNQSHDIISSQTKLAFPIAAIVVALWQKFPDFGTFFLAYMHKGCPYLVPYFIPQLQGQAPEDYFKTIGYKIVEGALEDQDKYLKRMTGLARLYAAVMITKPRSEDQKSPHPHGLDHGWKWLCNILNLDPLPDICATLLLEFLQIAGFEMWSVYGKQFVKVLQMIQTQYIPKLNLVDKGGPKSRLENFINEVMRDGKIEQPEGLLPKHFW